VNVGGESMVLEVIRVAVMEIEVLRKAGLARPKEYVMVTIAEVVCEAASKVACSKNEDT